MNRSLLFFLVILSSLPFCHASSMFVNINTQPLNTILGKGSSFNFILTMKCKCKTQVYRGSLTVMGNRNGFSELQIKRNSCENWTKTNL